MNQLVAMGITDYKCQRRFTVTGPVLLSMVLMVKVHKKNFSGREYVSQIDDPSYKICKELTDILNPIDKRGESYLRDIYSFKEILAQASMQYGSGEGRVGK